MIPPLDEFLDHVTGDYDANELASAKRKELREAKRVEFAAAFQD